MSAHLPTGQSLPHSADQSTAEEADAYSYRPPTNQVPILAKDAAVHCNLHGSRWLSVELERRDTHAVPSGNPVR